MSLLIIVAMLLFLPMFLGLLLDKIMRNITNNKSESYLMGVLCLFTLFEVVSTIGIKLELPFSTVFTIYIGICFVLLLIALWTCQKEITLVTTKLQEQLSISRGKIVFVLLFVLLSANFFVYLPFNVFDTVQETVRTTLDTNTIYQYNPLTGAELVNGMYPITKLNTLPIFYAGLQQISQIPLELLLYQIIPIWILFMNFLVCDLWGGKLFKSNKKRTAFLVWYAMLLLFAEEGSSYSSFKLLHTAWLGNTIIISMIIPFFLYKACFLSGEKKVRKGLLNLGIFVVTLVMLFNVTTMGNVVHETFLNFKDRILGYALMVLIYGVISGRFMQKKRAIMYCLGTLFCVLLGLWMPMIAFVMTDVFKWMPQKKYKDGLIGIALVIIFTGSLFLYGDHKDLEKYKTTTTTTLAISVIDAVQKLEVDASENMKMVAPNFIMEQVRKQSGTIQLPYGKDYWIENVNKEVGDFYDNSTFLLYSSMLEQGKNWGKVFRLAEEEGCNVLISPNSLGKDILKENWIFKQKVSKYYIYTR